MGGRDRGGRHTERLGGCWELGEGSGGSAAPRRDTLEPTPCGDAPRPCKGDESKGSSAPPEQEQKKRGHLPG